MMSPEAVARTVVSALLLPKHDREKIVLRRQSAHCRRLEKARLLSKL